MVTLAFWREKIQRIFSIPEVPSYCFTLSLFCFELRKHLDSTHN